MDAWTEQILDVNIFGKRSSMNTWLHTSRCFLTSSASLNFLGQYCCSFASTRLFLKSVMVFHRCMFCICQLGSLQESTMLVMFREFCGQDQGKSKKHCSLGNSLTSTSTLTSVSQQHPVKGHLLCNPWSFIIQHLSIWLQCNDVMKWHHNLAVVKCSSEQLWKASQHKQLTVHNNLV